MSPQMIAGKVQVGQTAMAEATLALHVQPEVPYSASIENVVIHAGGALRPNPYLKSRTTDLARGAFLIGSLPRDRLQPLQPLGKDQMRGFS